MTVDENPMSEEQIKTMLARRLVIGEAKGILMERYDLSSDAAHALLTRISQSTNTKLYDLARGFVASRRLPEPFEYLHDVDDEPSGEAAPSSSEGTELPG